MKINSKKNHMLLKKLLSHRLRGFAETELAPSSFEKIGDYPIAFFEVDTRVCADGTILAVHDPHFKASDGTIRKFAEETYSGVLAATSEENGATFMPLAEAMKVFKARSKPGQKLCIDIKDVGYELEHWKIVQEYQLQDQVIFISWAPQALEKMAKTGCSSPLILSHWNLLAFGCLGSVIEKMMANVCFAIGHLVLIGRNKSHHELGSLAIGFQHGLVCCELDQRLLNILHQNNGGICVHTSVAGRKLRTYCSQKNLSLSVFNTTEVQDFVKWAQYDEVDIVFSDNAPKVAKSLQDRAS